MEKVYLMKENQKKPSYLLNFLYICKQYKAIEVCQLTILQLQVKKKKQYCF